MEESQLSGKLLLERLALSARAMSSKEVSLASAAHQLAQPALQLVPCWVLWAVVADLLKMSLEAKGVGPEPVPVPALGQHPP